MVRLNCLKVIRMEIEYLLTNRGKWSVVIDDFWYIERTTCLNGTKYYKCKTNLCNSTVLVLDGQIVKDPQAHEHEDHKTKVCRQRIKNLAKEKVKEQQSSSIRNNFIEASSNYVKSLNPTLCYLLSIRLYKGKSTIDAIKFLVDKIQNRQQHFKYNLIMAVDASEAFDNLNWSPVIKNLTNANVQQKFVRAIENVLLNRTCLIDNTEFECKKRLPLRGLRFATDLENCNEFTSD